MKKSTKFALLCSLALASSAATTQAATNPFIVTINYIPHYGIAVWNAPAGKPVGKYLPHGSRWKAYRVETKNGESWINVGGSQWIEAKYVKEHVGSQANVTTSTTTQSSNAKPETTPQSTGVVRTTQETIVYRQPRVGAEVKTLNANTSWKYFKVVKEDNSEVYNYGVTNAKNIYWFNLGGNQWVQSTTVNPISGPLANNWQPYSTVRFDIPVRGVIKVTRNTPVYSDPNSGRKTGQVLKTGSKWKTFSEMSNGMYWYNVGRNQWVDGRDAQKLN